MSIHIVNEGVIEWYVLLLNMHLLSSSLNILFVLSMNSDFSELSLLLRTLVNVNLHTVLLLETLDLRALGADDESNERLVNPDLLHEAHGPASGRWLLLMSTSWRFHSMLHILALGVQENICLDGGSFQLVLGSQDNQSIIGWGATTDWWDRIHTRWLLKQIQLTEECQSLMIILRVTWQDWGDPLN